MTQRLKTAAAVVLGMHDALVSLTGMIGGLTFALADRRMIILSAVIASMAAGLSMAASCYLAEKTNENPHALRTGALVMSFVMAVLIIFGCNWCIGHARGRRWGRHALEMLIICAGVSIVSFAIGEVAKYALGVMI